MKRLLLSILVVLVLAATAWADVTVVQMDARVSGPNYGSVYHGTVTAGGDPAPAIEIPNAYRCFRLTMVITISSGSGYFEVTNSDKAAVIAGTGNWRPWLPGTASATQEASMLSPVSFVRCVAVTGSLVYDLQM